MNFLVLLGLYGQPVGPNSNGAQYDYNQNGYIDLEDLMEMLVMKPNNI